MAATLPVPYPPHRHEANHAAFTLFIQGSWSAFTSYETELIRHGFEPKMEEGANGGYAMLNAEGLIRIGPEDDPIDVELNVRVFGPDFTAKEKLPEPEVRQKVLSELERERAERDDEVAPAVEDELEHEAA